MNQAKYLERQGQGHFRIANVALFFRALPGLSALAALTALTALATLATLAACAGSHGRASTARPALHPTGLPSSLDVYRQLHFIAGDDRFPAVGRFLHLPGPGDSTIVILALSFPNSALHFRREPPGLLAAYRVTATVRDSVATQERLDQTREVRVRTYRETSRGDESVIFQGFFKLRPGRYSVAIEVRDLGSEAGLADERTLEVPDLGSPGLPQPVLAYRARPRDAPDGPLSLIVAPRATAVMDQPLPLVYVESTLDHEPLPILEILIDDEVIWSDTLDLSSPGSTGPDSVVGRSHFAAGLIELDPDALAPGSLMQMRTRAGSLTSESEPLLLALNENLLFADHEELLSYLRYAGTPEELDVLRAAPIGERARRLHAFWKRRDPERGTAENEFFVAYFGRIQEANNRFSEPGTPGWLTDRGAVYVTLGPPDEVLRYLDPVDLGPTGSQVWVYDRSLGFELRLFFAPDAGGFALARESRREFLEAIRRMYS